MEAAQAYGRTLIFMTEASNEDGEPIPGIFKTAKLPQAYLYNLQVVLGRKLLAYSSKVETLRIDRTGDQEIARLAKMFSYYHWDPKKQCYTSKGQGLDDIKSALEQLLYFAQEFYDKPFYKPQRDLIMKESGQYFPFPGSGNNIVHNMPTTHKRKRR